MIWFTADNHFWHKNVIDYCNRPFETVEEMNAELVRRWNITVSKQELIYILGDFALAGVNKTRSLIEQLNGTKVLIMGNHDATNHKAKKWLEMGMDDIHECFQIEHFGFKINISHFPYRGYEIDERKFTNQLEDDGNFLLHGHVHEAWKVRNKMINVGVDQWNYAPVSLPEILKEIQTINWEEVLDE